MNLLGPVLIVGAGIAGLALARKLALCGIPAELIERNPRNETQGAGILLTGNAVRVIDALGLRQRLAAQSRRVRSIRFTDERESRLFELEVSGRPGWAPFFSIERAGLQQILLDAVHPVVPRWGTTLVSMEEVGGEVEVRLSNESRRRYRLVVGADGVQSQVRELLFSAPAPAPIAGFHGWRFVAAGLDALDTPQYMLGDGRTLLLHPLPGGLVYCGAGPVSDGTLDGVSEPERLRSAFAGYRGLARDIVARVDGSTRLIRTRYWHIEQRPWHAGACVLIGDAAHACAPTLAQGAAMALEDAWVLGELLERHAEAGAALQAFEARRVPRVAWVQALSLERMAANRPLGARSLSLRNSVLAQIGAAGLLDAWRPLMEASA